MPLKAAPGSVGSMLNIVIYEDDFFMGALLREWLSEAGYGVRLAAQLDVRPDCQADLVIVSVYMPKNSGAEWVREIQAAYPGVPMIAISGQFRSGLSSAGAIARALGVQQAIAKPLVRSDLLDAVRGMIGTSAAARASKSCTE
jgi:DNA-binding response OmpR family regulator